MQWYVLHQTHWPRCIARIFLAIAACSLDSYSCECRMNVPLSSSVCVTSWFKSFVCSYLTDVITCRINVAPNRLPVSEVITYSWRNSLNVVILRRISVLVRSSANLWRLDSILTLPMLRLLLSKAQRWTAFWKSSKRCHVGTDKPGGGGGGTQVQRGAAPALRIRGRRGLFLRPPHVRDFVKEGYFFVPRYEVWGSESP